MKRFYFYLLVIGFLPKMVANLYGQPNPSIYKNWDEGFTKSLKNTHDLALPQWGPYSDKYNGISHIPMENDGFRFDVIIQPYIYMRTQTQLANVKRESGYHPWQATPDLSYFSYRYELEWKDQVFCDVSFSKVDEHSRLIRAEFVNNTNNNRSLALNIFNTIAFPYNKKITPILPHSVNWNKASNYTDFTDSVISWDYNLVYNGQLRGQVNDDDAVSRTAVLIGGNEGGKLNYCFSNNRNLGTGLIMIRYKTISGTHALLQGKINGKLFKAVDLPNSKEYSLAYIEVENLIKGDNEFSIKFTNKASVRLDGFALVMKDELLSITFNDTKLNYIPKQIACGIPNGIVLKYPNIKEFYGIIWDDLVAEKRELFDDNPDQVLFIFNNLVKNEKGRTETTRISGNNKGWFKNIFSAPIILKPKQKTSRYAYVVSGNNQEEVIDKLKRLNATWQNAEAIYQNMRLTTGYQQCNQAGKPYQLSQQLMEATTLTNLIYPTFTANKYIKHTTPGKKWSSLYT